MPNSFNLLTQPWLPCVDQQDRLKIMSLHDVMIQAHTLKTLRADLPIITSSLYLFLIAFTSAVFKPADDDEWEDLWNKGAFPPEVIQAYQDKWQGRFDLFDVRHPFYQDPQLGRRQKDLKALKKGQAPIPKGISSLLLHLASGSNATLFNHSMDEHPQRYSPAEAARILIMLQAYSLGGMTSASVPTDKYYKDSPFGRGVMFISCGSNLFQTLMLNMVPKDFDSGIRDAKDTPSWEQEDPFENEVSSPAGLCDLLSWQSRRLLLLPETEDGEISARNCLTAPGLKLPETLKNPYYHIRYEKKESQISLKPLRFQMGHALWRDSAAILDVNSDESDVPLPIKWFQYLLIQGILPKKEIHLELFGICTEPGQKKAYFYAWQSFVAPAIFLEKPNLLVQLKGGLAWAEDVRKTLYFSSSDLASFYLSYLQDCSDGKKPDPKDVAALISAFSTEEYYWSSLEPAFYAYLTNLPVSAEAHQVWQQALRDAARSSLNNASEMVGTNPPGLKARAKACQKLEYGMYQIFKPTDEGANNGEHAK